jgi:hypothetical protein
VGRVQAGDTAFPSTLLRLFSGKLATEHCTTSGFPASPRDHENRYGESAALR